MAIDKTTVPTSHPEPDSPHGLICQAYVENKVHLGLKYFDLNKRGSPVYKLWENVVPYAMIAIVVAQYTYDYGFNGFAISLVVLGLLGFYFIPRWLAKRVRARAMGMALAGEATWDELWKAGGLSMRLDDNPEIMCDSPNGDWRGFARQYLAD